MKKNELLSVLKLSGSLLVNQLVAILATLFITNIITFFSPGGLVLLRVIISVLIYTALIYVTSWSRGQSDFNRTKMGKLYNNKFRGFISGIFAAIPFFVLGTLAFLSESGRFATFNLFGVDGITAINRFANLPIGIFYNYANEYPIFNIIFPFYMPIVCGVAYILGICGISLAQNFIYKEDKE